MKGGFKNITSIRLPMHFDSSTKPNDGAKVTSLEIKNAKRIAFLRIRVKKTILRIREIKMTTMDACINKNLLYLMDNIVFIVCGIVYNQPPLIK